VLQEEQMRGEREDRSSRLLVEERREVVDWRSAIV
jgi:hypothetical protein